MLGCKEDKGLQEMSPQVKLDWITPMNCAGASPFNGKENKLGDTQLDEHIKHGESEEGRHLSQDGGVTAALHNQSLNELLPDLQDPAGPAGSSGPHSDMEHLASPVLLASFVLIQMNDAPNHRAQGTQQL